MVIEDSGREVTPEVTPTEPTVTETEPTVTETEPAIVETEPVVEVDENLLDGLINDFLKDLEVEEKPTEPTNFPKKEDVVVEDKKEDDDLITEEDIKLLEEDFEKLEKELAETKTELNDTKTKIEEINELLEKAKEENLSFEQALDKLGEHPILGPLNEKLLKGEELNIPDFLNKKIEEDINSIPQIDNITQIPIAPKGGKLSLQDKLSQNVKKLY